MADATAATNKHTHAHKRNTPVRAREQDAAENKTIKSALNAGACVHGGEQGASRGAQMGFAVTLFGFDHSPTRARVKRKDEEEED